MLQQDALPPDALSMLPFGEETHWLALVALLLIEGRIGDNVSKSCAISIGISASDMDMGTFSKENSNFFVSKSADDEISTCSELATVDMDCLVRVILQVL